MARGRNGWPARAAAGIGAAGLLALGACGGPDTKAPDSTRACAVVQADELSKITGARLRLLPAGKLPGVCRYRSSKDASAVDLAVTKPVEANSLSLLLDLPRRERDLGDEAWSSTTNTALDIRLLARRRGAMVSVDLTVDSASKADERTAARAIARAAIPELPSVKPAKPSGPRGAEACKPFTTDAIAEILGAKPEVTATQPPGSCLLTVADKGLNVTVSLLAQPADEKTLAAVIASAPEPELTDAAGMPAYWLPIPGNAAAGGQLDVLTGDALHQISVIGSGFEGTEARDLAVAIAKAGFGGS